MSDTCASSCLHLLLVPPAATGVPWKPASSSCRSALWSIIQKRFYVYYTIYNPDLKAISNTVCLVQTCSYQLFPTDPQESSFGPAVFRSKDMAKRCQRDAKEMPKRCQRDAKEMPKIHPSIIYPHIPHIPYADSNAMQRVSRLLYQRPRRRRAGPTQAKTHSLPLLMNLSSIKPTSFNAKRQT